MSSLKDLDDRQLSGLILRRKAEATSLMNELRDVTSRLAEAEERYQSAKAERQRRIDAGEWD